MFYPRRRVYGSVSPADAEEVVYEPFRYTSFIRENQKDASGSAVGWMERAIVYIPLLPTHLTKNRGESLALLALSSLALLEQSLG
jgi:hypothetical protein